MLNNAQVIGRLGKDPEIRATAEGMMVANLTVATSEKWKSKTGESKEHTEWHRVVFYDKVAQICEKYLKKGSLIYVQGKIKTRKWTDQNGQEKYSTEIVGSEMKMLGDKQPVAEQKPLEPVLDDIPF